MIMYIESHLGHAHVSLRDTFSDREKWRLIELQASSLIPPDLWADPGTLMTVHWEVAFIQIQEIQIGWKFANLILTLLNIRLAV